jgi:5S rRNA maturation endonuclease (ribonuclease M5)
MRKKTTQEFINEAINIHGNKYDYSKVEYINSKLKVIIICKVDDHGEFLQDPNHHLFQKRGCPKCTKYGKIPQLKKEKLKEQFIINAIKVHGDKFDYSKVKYMNALSKVIIICKIDNHGEFLQKPTQHLYYGCPRCSKNMKKTNEMFIKDSIKVHGDKYNYSKVKYINALSKVIIICKIDDHGEFLQIPNDHTHGSGCPKCFQKGGYSQKAIRWLNAISQTENIYIQHAENIGEYKIPNTNYKADGFCEKTNTIYEYMGCVWHGCKLCLNPDEYNHPHLYIKNKNIYYKSYLRIIKLIELGFNVEIIWEHETV